MKRIPFAAALGAATLFAHSLYAQGSPAHRVDSAYAAGDYAIFTGAGRPATLDDVVAAAGEHEVLFIGETHDDPTGHALELELLRRIHGAFGADRGVAASLEFFQRDVQPVVDEYLAGLITEQAFLADSRPWPRYETDYRPVVEYAKDHHLPVIAANAPRRYANMVTRLGRASLNELGEAALATLAPLPYGEASRPYVDQWVQAIMGVIEQEGTKCGVPVPADSLASGAPRHAASVHSAGGSQLDGQVLWDATMAYWISDHLVRHPDALVLHMVGSFHVARGTGIPEHLVRYRPGASSLVVMMRPVDRVDVFDPAPSGEWGDFVIQTDRSRTLEVLECRRGTAVR